MHAITLPGSIPGLLRNGSPVIDSEVPDVKGVVYEADSANATAAVLYLDDDGDPRVAYFPSCGGGMELLALDLRAPTGRCHAAWWVDRMPTEAFGRLTNRNRRELATMRADARDNECRPAPDEGWRESRISRFRDLCLKLAGLQ